jgi:hypothetical protein
MAKLWYSFYALGRAGMPSSVEVDGAAYALERVVKHDFWAATGFYLAASGAVRFNRIVVKINRTHKLGILPMRWAGGILARREMRAYDRLQHLHNIPRLLGPVTSCGFAHEYVEGVQLGQHELLPADFFAQLDDVIDQLNRAGIAYVDMNKRQNILVGDDGRPHLIDFQIHFDRDSVWPRRLGEWILSKCRRGDLYHAAKHKRRFQPGRLTDADRELIERRGPMIRLHRLLFKPYFAVRRPMMRWLTRSGRIASTGTD